MSGLTSVMRDFYGVYPITGKVLNVRKASPAQINRNKFIQDLTKILKLELQKEYTDTSSLRYGRVILMTDQVSTNFLYTNSELFLYIHLLKLL